MPSPETAIAVTGATGFIGRSVIKQLLERGYHINALCRSPREQEGVRYIKGDLASQEALKTLASGTDAFMHIAGLTKARTLKKLMEVNETGSANAAQAARDAGVRRFILVSSIAAREPHLSNYAKSKRAGEEIARKTLEGSSTELIIVRPPAIIGPGDDATAPMLNILRRGFLPAPNRKKQKTSRMSFVYMDDIARFLIEQIDAPIASSVVTPHGGTPKSSWQDLADSAARVLSKPVRVIPIPSSLLAISALLSQAVSAFFLQSGFFNAGKVRELLHSDWTGETEIANAYTLDQALRHAFGLDIDL